MRITGSIRNKIWICVAVALAGYLIATVSSVFSNSRLAEDLGHVQTFDFPLSLDTTRLVDLFKKQSKYYEDAFLTGEVEEARLGNQLGEEISSLLEKVTQLAGKHSQKEKEVLTALRSRYEEYFRLASVNYVRTIGVQGAGSSQQQEIQRLGKMRTALLGDFEAAAAHFIASFQKEIENGQSRVHRNTVFLMALFLLVLILVTLIIGAVSNRLLVRPLGDIQRMVKDFSQGKPIRQETVEAGGDEIAELAASFQRMTVSLHRSTALKKYLDNIIRSMNDCLLVTTPDAMITMVNQTLLDLLEYREEELINQPLQKILSADGREQLGSEGLAELMHRGFVNNVETFFAGRDGRGIPVLISAAVMCSGDGGVEGLVFVARDIADLKRTEEALRESEQQLKRVLDSIHAGIIIINPTTHTIVDANSFALKEIGVTREELFGRSCHQYICPALRGACPITDLGETVDNSERVLIKANGERIPILKAVVPVRYNGTDHLIESFIDISHLKEIETELQSLNLQLCASNDELQGMNEDLKNFAYIVSHDLRAPLVNIKGFSSELTVSLREMDEVVSPITHLMAESDRDRLDRILHDEIPEAIDFISSSVRRMDTMIAAILKLSRLGRRELASEPVSLNDLVSGILKTLAHQLEERQVTVTMNELPDLVMDRGAMEQIFGNLLDNAVKYLEPGRPGKIVVSSEWMDGEFTICVRDNGRGIAVDEMHKVFEVFRRAGRQDTPGEGMGLAYVKALLKTLGGRIWCESGLGVGTSFCFTLPDRYARLGGRALERGN